MRAPLRNDGGEAIASASVTTQVLIVFLVIALGATIYLWRGHYMRRRTAYVTMGVLVIALVLCGMVMYTGGV